MARCGIVADLGFFFFFEIYDLEGAKKKMGERRVFVFY